MLWPCAVARLSAWQQNTSIGNCIQSVQSVHGMNCDARSKYQAQVQNTFQDRSPVHLKHDTVVVRFYPSASVACAPSTRIPNRAQQSPEKKKRGNKERGNKERGEEVGRQTEPHQWFLWRALRVPYVRYEDAWRCGTARGNGLSMGLSTSGGGGRR